MALTIDFTKDIRYQQGIKAGVEKGIKKGAIKMIEQNYTFEQIWLVTGLSVDRLKELAKSIGK